MLSDMLIYVLNQPLTYTFNRLVSERELQLFDGTRLMGMDRYKDIQEETGLTDAEMKDKQILPIHPSFRVIALSEPPVPGVSLCVLVLSKPPLT